MVMTVMMYVVVDWNDFLSTLRTYNEYYIGVAHDECITVSDFINKVSGFFRDGQDQARLLLETHLEGYFTNDPLLAHVEKTFLSWFTQQYFYLIMYCLTNKQPDDALNADKMNVGLGGKQPKMRDIIWGRAIQHMVDDTVSTLVDMA